MSSSPLKRSTIIAFILPAIPIAGLGLPLTVYLPPLYAGQTALTLASVGSLFFLARVFDIVTDPLFGAAADRTRSRFGRRRPWIAISVPILMLAVYKTFNPPVDAGAAYLLAWLFVLYLGYTLFTLSHVSWGAELSDNYDERSRVQGWREAALIGGMLSILVLPAIIEMSGMENTERTRASIMSYFIMILLPLTVGVAVVRVKERASLSEAPPFNALGVVRGLWRNPYLLRVLAADLLAGIGPAVTGALYVFLAVHHFQLPQYTSLILLVYFGSALAGMPLWLQVSYRVGKHNAFAAAMAFGALTLLAFFTVPPGNFPLAAAATFAYGVAYGAGPFLLRAMMADVVDHDRLETGENRTGVYYSLLTLTAKFGGAFGPLIAYPFLQFVGFDPKPGTEMAPGTEYWVLVTFAVPPIIVFVLAALTMWRFPLDREVQQEMRARLADKEADLAAAPPAPAEDRPNPATAQDQLCDARPAE